MEIGEDANFDTCQAGDLGHREPLGLAQVIEPPSDLITRIMYLRFGHPSRLSTVMCR
jgi:hypothetical protein